MPLQNGNPTRTDYEGPPLSGPGILWINSKVVKPDELSDELFQTWYEQVHIPDLIAARPGGIIASWRYRCFDPERSAPYLALYSVPDLGFLTSPEFKAVPMVHDMLPGGGPIHRFASFDARYYKQVQVYETENSKPGRAHVIISAALEPSDEMDFDNWYREEHLEQMSHAPGWRRTVRYKLVFKKETKGVPESEKAPKWLTLLEFEPGSLSKSPKVEPPLPQTEWTKKVMGSLKKADVAKFEFIRGFGDLEAPI